MERPKANFLERAFFIIQRLERGPATMDEINQFLQNESEIQDKDFTLSQRTLQRDIHDIYTQFGYWITNERKGDRAYFIKERPEERSADDRQFKMLESLQLFNIARNATIFSHYIFPETRKPLGLESFPVLLFAIRNRRVLSFTHHKYWEDDHTNRKVYPLALKESQGRWYLCTIDTKDEKFKTFGLDRIANVEVSKSVFDAAKYSVDIAKQFEHSFGIISSIPPTEIKLAFSKQQGQYVQSFPLHHSQKTLLVSETEIVVSLFLSPTEDFKMELLRYGNAVKVLSPQSLATDLRTIYTNALQQYNH